MLTNERGTSLYMAVWLANDDYDYSNDPKEISVTSLIKPIKQTILGSRVDKSKRKIDVQDVAAARTGTAVHDSVENVWLHPEKRRKALKSLGYEDDFINRVVVNPDRSEKLLPGSIPIYLEQRSKRKLEGYTLSGKYDGVFDGMVKDIKTTSVYSYMSGDKEKDYILQGSMYRWLNPEIITAGKVEINFVFGDYSKTKAEADKTGNYPPNKIQSREYPLMSLEQTENYISGRLKELNNYWDEPEENIPACSKEELWLGDDKSRYYKDVKNTKRATKVFTGPDAVEQARLYSMGKPKGSGIITEYGQAKACEYCAAVSICKQAKALNEAGRLNKYEQLIEVGGGDD